MGKQYSGLDLGIIDFGITIDLGATLLGTTLVGSTLLVIAGIVDEDPAPFDRDGTTRFGGSLKCWTSTPVDQEPERTFLPRNNNKMVCLATTVMHRG